MGAFARSVTFSSFTYCSFTVLTLRTLLLIPKRREQRELSGGTIWEGEGKRGDRTVGRELNQPWEWWCTVLGPLTIVTQRSVHYVPLPCAPMVHYVSNSKFTKVRELNASKRRKLEWTRNRSWTIRSTRRENGEPRCRRFQVRTVHSLLHSIFASCVCSFSSLTPHEWNGMKGVRVNWTKPGVRTLPRPFHSPPVPVSLGFFHSLSYSLPFTQFIKRGERRTHEKNRENEWGGKSRTNEMSKEENKRQEQGWPCTRESFSEFNRQSRYVQHSPFLTSFF